MRYKIEEIEKQIIDHLYANVTVSGVLVKTHAGEVNPISLMNEETVNGYIQMLPFIFIHYLNRKTYWADDNRHIKIHDLTFRFYVAQRSLPTGRDGQIGCYELLRQINDAISGKLLMNYQTFADSLWRLSGWTISDVQTSGSDTIITVDATHLTTGDYVFISGCTGLTGINNDSTTRSWQITKIDSANVKITGNTFAGTYTASSGKLITALTNAEINQQSAIVEVDGNSERLVASMPDFQVYSADYHLYMMA